MMKLIVAVWPNNTVSILRIKTGGTMVHVYDQLNEAGYPLDAKCFLLRADGRNMHVSFDWKAVSEDLVGPQSSNLGLTSYRGSKKRLRWPSGIEKLWAKMIEASSRKYGSWEEARKMSADEIPLMPNAPPPSHKAEEVRLLKPFCGVYLSYNADGKCHYVGESASVPTRVSKSRPEIGDRLLGLVRCEPHERKRIEAYYIAMLDPPGNANSTHAMLRHAARVAAENVRMEEANGTASN